jgi:hypothetical protein
MLNLFSPYLLEERNRLIQSKEEYRKCKINKYINKRNDICSTIILNLQVTIDMNTILDWYDFFMDYSTMELLDEKKFFRILKHIEFFSNMDKELHSILFHTICTIYQDKAIIQEFIVFLLLFHDPSEVFI